MFLSMFVPESPRWLYSKNRYDEMVSQLQKIAKWNGVHPKGNSLQDRLESFVDKESWRAKWFTLQWRHRSVNASKITINSIVCSIAHYSYVIWALGRLESSTDRFFVNGLSRLTTKKISILITGPLWEESPVTGIFSTKRDSNAKCVSVACCFPIIIQWNLSITTT